MHTLLSLSKDFASFLAMAAFCGFIAMLLVGGFA